MKNLIMATVLGLLLFGANAPAEASTVESALGSQVEVVEVMHPPQHWHRERRWNPHTPRDDWRHRDHRRERHPHVPHSPGGRRW